MNKYDWIEAGTRLLGVWFLSQGVIGFVRYVLIAGSESSRLGQRAAMEPVLTALFLSFFGTVLLLMAPALIRFLRASDARAEERVHEGQTGEA